MIGVGERARYVGGDPEFPTRGMPLAKGALGTVVRDCGGSAVHWVPDDEAMLPQCSAVWVCGEDELEPVRREYLVEWAFRVDWREAGWS